MKISTKILHPGNEIDPATGAVSLPVYHASTFKQDSADSPGEFDYTRSGNPTRKALEENICVLEGGTRGFAFSSGMAAISSVLLLFSPGDHLVVCSDVYGGTYRALTRIFAGRLNMEVTFTDTTDLNKTEKAIRKNTKGLFLESPSNPLLKITDLRGAASLARSKGIITIVDNTFMTPYFQRPLELGADIVLHSATKYLGGHSDLLAGLAVAINPDLAGEIKMIQNSFGAVLGPQDCWLLMRGMKTLKVRMEQHQQGAMAVAEWLRSRPGVTEVYYPGLSGHSGKRLHGEQASGFGGIVSFRMETPEAARHVLERVKIPALAVSLGAVESIISYPYAMSHAAMPEELKKELAVTEDLIRLSVGLEDPDDLIADLDQAMS